jgi:hypothetical protein
MHPAKRLLADYIIEHLPKVLREHRGAMPIDDARSVIETSFRTEHGWHPILDDLDIGTRTVARNAWGFALKELNESGVTESTKGQTDYRLTKHHRSV